MQIDVEALFSKSIVVSRQLLQEGNLDTAHAVLKQLLRCDENHGEALQLIGLIHHKKGEHALAIPFFERAISVEPENPDNFNNLALALSCTGNVPLAVEKLGHAIDLCRGIEDRMKSEAQFRSNLGIQLRQLGRYEEAVMHLSIALEYNENDPNFWQNLGGVYGEMHRTEDAVTCYRKSLELNPANPVGHTDLAHGLHLLGQWEEAWEHYEHRYEAFYSFPQMSLYNFRYDPAKRLKKGDDISGKRVIVFAEQGLGDAIQFVRYISPFWQPKCHIIFQCAPELAALLENTKNHLGIDEFCTTPLHQFDVPVPDHDYHVSLLSLPYITGCPVAGQPSPYVIPSKVADLDPEKFKIGIAWTGSPTHPNDQVRSCPLKFFKPLSEIPGVQLYSFQKDVRPRRYRNRPDVVDYTEGVDFKMLDMSEMLTDFDKAAGLLMGMDLVVSVDTSLLHLAGALRIPTIGLIAYNPCWRWGIEGESTPWYPSLTLVRQEKPGDWGGVMSKVAQMAKEKTCGPTTD